MKKILLFQIALLFISANAMTQNLAAKEKAEALAKDEFSKTKYKKKEKFGVVKELKRVIESTPVVKENASFYNGNYVYHDLNYKIEIRTDKQGRPMATLNIANGPDVLLKEVSITDAFFHAVKQNADGTKEVWEGVFINKNDDGNIELGLGIKLANPIQLTEGLKITRIFLKKVSP
ncbi:MAG TPA: hypothetical protein VMY77_09780 [Chitinophagaceae bacterium]|nr:hypothetical protein [Chitinophagaceae bacterium]